MFIFCIGKERDLVSKAYSNLKPNISVESSPVYSACFDNAGISPVSAIIFSDLPEGRFDLSVSIECKCGNENVFSFEQKTFFSSDTKMFDASAQGKMILKISYDSFKISSDFLKNNKSNINAQICTCVKVDENTYEIPTQIQIAAGNEWTGSEFHPEALATFVTPFSNEIDALTGPIDKSSGFASFSEALSAVGAIVKNIRNKNIICARRDAYSPEKSQTVKVADELVSKSAVIATPLELALLFCGCAYRCGLAPAIVFAKNPLGVTSVFCGIDLTVSAKNVIISESITKIRHALENSEMILIDPAVMSSAEKSEVQYANNSASEYFHRANTQMYFSLNITAAFNNGVLTLNGKIVENKIQFSQARDELANIYTGLVNRPVFKMLGGDYGAYDIIALIGADIDRFDEKNVFVPLEISEKLDIYAGLADNFASFATKDIKQKAYNKAEFEQVQTKYASFCSRILSKKNIVTGLHENSFHEKASRMTFGNAKGMKNYLIGGFVRLTEAQTGETRFLPISFSEITLDYRYNYSFTRASSRLVTNTVLASYLTNRYVDFSGINTIEKAFQLFEKLAESARKFTPEFSEITLIKEYAIIKADLSDYILWNDIKLHGKNMLSNKNFASVLVSEKQTEQSENKNNDFVFPLFVPENIKDILNSNSNIIVTGESVTEKGDLFVNKAVKEITDSGKVVVSSDNKAFLDEVYSKFENNSIAECALRLDEGITVPELVKKMIEKLNDASEYDDNPPPYDFAEYRKLRDSIEAFDKLLTESDNDLGISFLDILKSYYLASKDLGEYADTVLELDKNAFSDISRKKFNKLFEVAEKLVVCAINAQETAELEKSIPLCQNAFYPLNPALMIDDAQIQSAFELIDRILAVLSEYRETFYDISGDLGIETEDIKNLSGLHSLNELYKLIIFARELEIPDNISSYNISETASNAEFIQKSKQRIENIEYRLRFFSSEIFEDVDTLLSGYNYSEHSQKGFIKKFIVRKNNKDVLLQYVPNEKRSEFYQNDTEEIYKLLNEYKNLKAAMTSNEILPLDENGVKLAVLVNDARKLLSDIYPELLTDDNLLNSKMRKIFTFIKRVSNDASISKKLTYARAKLAQVYSENECLISKLCKLISADFSSMSFDRGILGYDGFGGYLKMLEKLLPSLETWVLWLNAKKNADEYMPSFSEYIINVGVKENTDRIFAVSLIVPAMKYISEKFDIKKKKAEFDAYASKYQEIENKAQKMSVQNMISSYKRTLKHYAQIENLADFEQDVHLPMDAFVNKYKDVILNIYPCIFINSADAGTFFGAEKIADLLICDGSDCENLIVLSSVALAERVMLVNYFGCGGYLGKKLEEQGAKKAKVSYHTHKANRTLCSLYGNGFFPGTIEDNSHISLITVNGTMRRTSDLANAQEAEICVTKALELAEKGESSIAVFALTHGQKAYIEHLLCLNSENNKIAADAIDNKIIKVIDASDACYEKFENAIISLGAATDKNGNIGWSFGCGSETDCVDSLLNIANSAYSDTLIVTSLSLKDLAKLSKTGTEAQKLYSTILLASQGVIPAATDCFADEDDIFISELLRKHPDSSKSKGRFESASNAVSVSENKIYMLDFDGQTNIFDRLSVRKMFSDTDTQICDVSFIDRVLKNI